MLLCVLSSLLTPSSSYSPIAPLLYLLRPMTEKSVPESDALLSLLVVVLLGLVFRLSSFPIERYSQQYLFLISDDMGNESGRDCNVQRLKVVGRILLGVRNLGRSR
ncbi:hypothetical protein GGS21DRAFT_498441 [Xylaria nigripes]|nr:hypothetical protein GGS21DRAFT_498441 [Xylaria nigripes]